MPDAIPTPRLVAGLGNPGQRYRNTRHNIGFLVVEAVAARLGAEWREERRWQCEVAKAAGPSAVTLAKPQTFMNASGEAVGPLARYQRIEPVQVLAVVDDVDLPFGRLRLRPKGGCGGHNGLRSLARHFGTEDYPRLRVGVGRPAGAVAMTGHVLGKFAPDEKEELANVLERATLCVLSACGDGIEHAMNVFNPGPGEAESTN